MRPRQITLIGLGLIGGSLAGACRKKFPRAKIVGISRNRRALAKAKKKGWIHEGYQDLNQAFAPSPFPLPLQGEREWGRSSRGHSSRTILRSVPGRTVPLVILCTPVDTLKDFLKCLDRVAPKGTMVTDTGSVKGFLVRWADRENWRNIYFVGAHPMAGSHERGIDHAEPHLFEDALTFVTPGKRTSPKAFREVKEFWKKISHRVAVISPETHDRITGEISHLPHLVAALLVAGVSAKSLRFAASGFLDTTRVAQGDPGLWVPILTENRKELDRSLARFGKHLTRIRKILKKGDRRTLERILTRIQSRRRALE